MFRTAASAFAKATARQGKRPRGVVGVLYVPGLKHSAQGHEVPAWPNRELVALCYLLSHSEIPAIQEETH